MKRSILFLSLSILLSQNALAASKTVSLPFENEQIKSASHNGLSFTYDLQMSHGKAKNKVVCKLENVYKSWLEFSDSGAAAQSGVYGGSETVVLTANHQTDFNKAIFHVDAIGGVKVMDLKLDGKASCHTEADVA